jgi:xanthine dehydrogenase molybdopterin-binding subunit B
LIHNRSNSNVIIIDIEAASKVDGFVSFVSYIDVPGLNKPNGSLPDEEVFVSSVALCIGATIGVVVCETEESAKIASNLIKIDYELLFPKILTIEDAINHQSYFGDEICLRQGDINQSFVDTNHILEGELFIGGQEHFYMETNACMVIPSNDDQEITLYMATQSPTSAQELLSLVLNRDAGRITCHTKRIGGAFGGKESRSYVKYIYLLCSMFYIIYFSMPPCLAIAVAAVKVNRPVRIRLERDVDMCITGHRHPFKVNYKVAFDNEGRFCGLDLQMWNNGGCTLDASQAVMELSMLHVGNCYQFHNIQIRGRVCKTHLPSNTGRLEIYLKYKIIYSFSISWFWWSTSNVSL